MIIHDDFFLTLVASISSICNGICRPFWGWVVRGGRELHGRAARRRANPLLVGRAGVLHERPLPDVHGNAPVGKIKGNKKSDLFRLMDSAGKRSPFLIGGEKNQEKWCRRFPKGAKLHGSVRAEGVKGAIADFVRFHCPLVASAEAKSSACGEE